MKAEEFAAKTGLSALWTIIAYYTGKVTALIWLLILFEVSDYVTGVVSACLNGGLSSGEAVKGAIKKLFYFVLVGVGFGVDYVITEVAGTLGLDFDYPSIFGVLTVCYLLSTEAISILENLGELGIEVPFLSKLIKKMHMKISEKGGEDDK